MEIFFDFKSSCFGWHLIFILKIMIVNNLSEENCFQVQAEKAKHFVSGLKNKKKISKTWVICLYSD